MNKKNLVLLLVLASQISFCQLTILQCLKLNNFELSNYSQADLMPTDTIVDVKNGYYEIQYKQDEKTIVLCQATVFNNSDGTQLLAITGYSADEQCGGFNTYAYSISKSGKEIVELEMADLIRDVYIQNFLKDSRVLEIAEKYLPQIQSEYLDNEATVEQVLEELYDIHFILPQKGSVITTTLTICDYIPTNIGIFSPEDWAIIETDFSTINFVYNKNKKVFYLK